ncbi:MAG: hypothetical protein H0T50_06915 [Gemmatimonadales bacterium]|nr:hypothetical protein [Gemmatimonadales bacterium]
MTGRATALLVALLTACSPRPPAPAGGPAPSGAANVAAPEEPVVTLERAPCFGTCPVYRVAISGSGAVRFVGRQHVIRQGEVADQIPPERVDSLLGELEAGGYFGFADAYVRGSPACGQYATDSPTVITSATADGHSKTIRHDYGCSAAPPELGRLERMIDEVAGTARWTGP